MDNRDRKKESPTLPDREKKRLSGRAVIALLGAALILSVLCSFALGRYPIGLRELGGIVFSRLPFFRIEPF